MDLDVIAMAEMSLDFCKDDMIDALNLQELESAYEEAKESLEDFYEAIKNKRGFE